MRTKRILIVDDDPNVRRLLRVNLVDAGYDVTEASDGNEAENIVKGKAPPDLVLLDIMMPNVDGWEVCKMIRDSRLGDTILIVMLTARASHRDKLIGKEILKADEYVTKPFDINNLLQTIERLLTMNHRNAGHRFMTR